MRRNGRLKEDEDVSGRRPTTGPSSNRWLWTNVVTQNILMEQILHHNLWNIAHLYTWGWRLKLSHLLKTSTYTYETVSAMNTVNHHKVVSKCTGEYAAPPPWCLQPFPRKSETEHVPASLRGARTRHPLLILTLFSGFDRGHIPLKGSIIYVDVPTGLWAPSLLFFTLSPSSTMPGTQGKFREMFTGSLWSWNRARHEAICNKEILKILQI